VDKDLIPMLDEARGCLEPGGAILASTNDARWGTRDFMAEIEKFARRQMLRVEGGRTPSEFGPAHPL
jgi:23S rRNA G2069 N7-methylase RlmK/C1962 C5-methylase RlmI